MSRRDKPEKIALARELYTLGARTPYIRRRTWVSWEMLDVLKFELRIVRPGQKRVFVPMFASDFFKIAAAHEKKRVSWDEYVSFCKRRGSAPLSSEQQFERAWKAKRREIERNYKDKLVRRAEHERSCSKNKSGR
jgi:hypothetical protein